MAKAKKKVEKPIEKPEVIENQESVKDWTPPPRAPKYRVKKGKSISCQKGILGPGAAVEADFVGGEECLEALLESEHVEKY